MFKRNREKKEQVSGNNGKAQSNPTAINQNKHAQKMIEHNHYSQALFIPLRGDIR
jgi:hypothetical protein